jgi:hypothetical protein
MAMAYGIEYIEMYLKGRKFKVIYDHTALTYAKIKHIFGNMKLERMRERLQSFDFTIRYKKGTELVNADFLSRFYENQEPIAERNLHKNVPIDSKRTWYY